jgi:hypothetical protein
MAQGADDPIGQASQGANWLVGLSGAAIGGALAKLDWILKFPVWGKIGFLVGASFFMLSILVGVFYAFQLFATRQRKQKLDEEKARNPQVQHDLDEAKTNLDLANKKISKFHYATMITFAFACIATVSCLGAVLFNPVPSDPKPLPVAQNAYTLGNFPVHAGGRLSHSHTFLLNQQTGVVWQMTCTKGNVVEFHRVRRTGLDGLPDDDPVKPATQNDKVREAN